jgi:hypothetical protein
VKAASHDDARIHRNYPAMKLTLPAQVVKQTSRLRLFFQQEKALRLPVAMQRVLTPCFGGLCLRRIRRPGFSKARAISLGVFAALRISC